MCVCVRACVRACVRVCMRACMCVLPLYRMCGGGHVNILPCIAFASTPYPPMYMYMYLQHVYRPSSPLPPRALGGTGSLRLPPWGGENGDCLMDYVPHIHKLLADKVLSIVESYVRRKELCAALLSVCGQSVLEYDTESFKRLGFLFEHLGFSFVILCECLRPCLPPPFIYVPSTYLYMPAGLTYASSRDISFLLYLSSLPPCQFY